MKLALIVSLGLIASVSHASFDLLLMYDSANRQIVRYDPVNRVSLGAFGQGQLGYFSNDNIISLDPSRPNVLAAMDVQGAVRYFNYSTGTQIGGVNTGTAPAIQFSTRFLMAQNGNIVRLAPGQNAGVQLFSGSSGALLSTMPVYSGFETRDVINSTGGNFLTLERSVNGSNFNFHVFLRNSSGLFLGSVQVGTAVGAETYSRLNLAATQVVIAGHSSGFPDMTRVSFNGSTFGSPQNFIGSAVSGTGMSNLVSGHFPTSWMIQSTASGPRLYVIDHLNAAYYLSHTLPYSGTSFPSIALVVAPEPASFLVLGAMTVGLLRRRKR